MSQLALEVIEANKRSQNNVLDLGNCGLTELPDLSGMDWVETLILSDWWEEFDVLRNNRAYFKSQNKGLLNRFENASPYHSQFPSLKKLIAPNLGINDAGFLENLTSLTSLNLSSNKISEWRFLENLTNLNSLNISYNQINNLQFLEKLTSLNSLDISGNQISDARVLEKLINITSLDIGGNQISDATALENLTNLTLLSISSSQINDWRFLEKFSNLTSLDIRNNNINNADFLEKLINLISLDISYNQISDTNGLERLTNLTSLYIGNNQISDSSGLERLINLTSLDISFNQIRDTKSLEKLTSLTTLDINCNQISDATSLEKLTNLTSLNIWKNQISDITSIKGLTLLKHLELWGNPVREVPRALLEEYNCLEIVKAWWAETENPAQTEPNRCIKLMLNGNGNAGKSTLFHALRDGKCEKEMDSTHGILLDTWNCALDPTVEFIIWDFGGQEIYQGTHRLFMESEAIQLILIDPEKEVAANDKILTPDRVTGEATREQPLQYWIETIRKLSSGSELMVVQNKKDVHTERYQPAYLLSAKANADYYHVSAKRGDSIPLLQAAIHDKAQRLLDYGMPMPSSWITARQHFLNNLQKPITERERLLSRTKFFQRCHETFGVKEMAIPALLKLLHYTGIVYYNEQFLKDTIIIDQRWALEAIYKPLDRESDFYDMLRNESYGKTRVKHLFRAFGNGYLDSDKWLFLHFMRSCGLCFPKLEKRSSEKESEEDYYVFPEFLPAEMPQIAQRFGQENVQQIRYYRRKYDYLNYYRIQSFIAGLGQKTNLENVWRNGIMILANEGDFKVYADYENDAVVVAIEARAQNKWLRKILNQWENHQENQEFKDWEYSENGQDYAPVDARMLSSGFEEAKNAMPHEEKKSLVEHLPDIPAKKRPFRLVASYAKENRWAVEAVKKQLSGLRQEGKIEFWYDQKLEGRAFWDDEIKEHFEEADGYLAFISPEYVDDEVKTYIHQEEIPLMLERKKGKDQIPTFCITVTTVDYGPNLRNFNFFSDKQAIPREEAANGEFLSRFVEEIVRGKLLKTVDC